MALVSMLFIVLGVIVLVGVSLVLIILAVMVASEATDCNVIDLEVSGNE